MATEIVKLNNTRAIEDLNTRLEQLEIEGLAVNALGLRVIGIYTDTQFDNNDLVTNLNSGNVPNGVGGADIQSGDAFINNVDTSRFWIWTAGLAPHPSAWIGPISFKGDMPTITIQNNTWWVNGFDTGQLVNIKGDQGDTIDFSVTVPVTSVPFGQESSASITSIDAFTRQLNLTLQTGQQGPPGPSIQGPPGLGLIPSFTVYDSSDPVFSSYPSRAIGFSFIYFDGSIDTLYWKSDTVNPDDTNGWQFFTGWTGTNGAPGEAGGQGSSQRLYPYLTNKQTTVTGIRSVFENDTVPLQLGDPVMTADGDRYIVTDDGDYGGMDYVDTMALTISGGDDTESIVTITDMPGNPGSSGGVAIVSNTADGILDTTKPVRLVFDTALTRAYTIYNTSTITINGTLYQFQVATGYNTYANGVFTRSNFTNQWSVTMIAGQRGRAGYMAYFDGAILVLDTPINRWWTNLYLEGSDIVMAASGLSTFPDELMPTSLNRYNPLAWHMGGQSQSQPAPATGRILISGTWYDIVGIYGTGVGTTGANTFSVVYVNDSGTISVTYSTTGKTYTRQTTNRIRATF